MDDGFEQVPIDFATEDVIVGVLKEMRTIDEDVIRLRWRGMPAGASLDARVLSLVGGNGVEYNVIMNTLEALGAV